MFDLREKPILIYIYGCGFRYLCPCVYVMCWHVLSVIMYMGICMCDGSLAWARKCIEFSMNEKVDFSKRNFCFMRFCIGGHLLKLCGGHLLRARGPERRKVPRMVQSATHSTKCHIAGYVFHRKKMRKFESDRNRFLWIYFIVFPKDHGISSIALCISMYVFSL